MDIQRIVGGSFEEILGQDEAKTAVKSALLARHNIILVGPPGVGKTTLARAVAALLPERELRACGYNCAPGEPRCPACLAGKEAPVRAVPGAERFVRVQGSPDLTAEDLVGDIDPAKALAHGPRSLEAFTPGKLFHANNGVLFFDEVNRCTEKLQNALLQALEERKVTVGGYDVDLAADFLFVGTMNPDDSSTERLSDVFLDRFDLVTMTYPESAALERAIVDGRRLVLDGVSFPEPLLDGVIAFVRALREDRNLDRKPSVRATISVASRALATARVRGAATVSDDDVRRVVVSVLSHRISLKPSAKYVRRVEDFLEESFAAFARDALGGEG